MAGLQDKLDSVKEAEPQQAVATLRDIALGQHSNDGDNVRIKEAASQQLADAYAKQKDANSLKQLLVDLRPLFAVIPKAKTAKLVRTIIEAIAKVPNSSQLQGSTGLLLAPTALVLRCQGQQGLWGLP